MIDESTRVVHASTGEAAGGWRERVWKYVEVTKPSTVALLVVTCIGAMVAAGGVGALSLVEWAVALVAITRPAALLPIRSLATSTATSTR